MSLQFFKCSKIIALISAVTLTFTTNAIDRKIDLNNTSTVVSFQVFSIKQIQQDEIQATLRLEKSDQKSEEVQSQINNDMKTALELAKKYSDVKTSTGRYFVYKDEQKTQWKGSQTILLSSFTEKSMSQLAGELQKSGFIMDNFSYTLSEKNKRSMDDEMRVELIQKATQIASNVIAKGLNKKFSRFSQIDFNSQNYYPIISLRSSSIGANSSNNPVAQAGLSDVQMTANVSAVFND